MIESHQDAELPRPSERHIEVSDDAFLVDAVLIGQLLHVPAARVPTLMREGQITSVCERGVDEHEGEFRYGYWAKDPEASLEDFIGKANA